MLGEDDITAPTPKLGASPAPDPGSAEHMIEHCRMLRENLVGIGQQLAGLREEIDRSLREPAPSAPAPATTTAGSPDSNLDEGETP